MLRPILLTILVLTISGCKLLVMVPRGGEVQSTASGTCFELTNCVHDVTDTAYTESFTAVPAAGFRFVKWNGGDNFYCADSTNPTCIVNTGPLAGNVTDAFIAEFPEDVYIMPVFSDRTPISDTVTADGKEWAQPAQFTNLSWDDIDAVCPAASGGACSGGLAGWDMTGWTWAAVDDLNALFNSYGVNPSLGPGPDQVAVYCSQITAPVPWSGAFFAAGWTPTESTSTTLQTTGYVRDYTSGSYGRLALLSYTTDAVFEIVCPLSPSTLVASASTSVLSSVPSPNYGAFFYRNP
jgi:hypothetical protein